MDYRRWLRVRPQSSDEVARDIDDELDAHLAMRTEALTGTAGERARLEALHKFGDYDHARAELIRNAQARRQRQRRFEWLHGLKQDGAYALRRAGQRASATALAVMLLALSIGLTTAVFTLFNGVLVRALPFAHADRLYSVATLDSAGGEVGTLSLANWHDWRAQSRTVAAGALYRTFRSPVLLGAEALRSTVTFTTGDFFQVLTVPMVAGRAYTHAEAQTSEPAAVVSEGYWRSVLGSRPLPIPATISGQPLQIVGVANSGYEFPRGTEIWVGDERESPGAGMMRNYINYEGILRIAPAATYQQADQELDAISQRIQGADPASMYMHGVVLRPLKEKIVGDAARYLPMLMAAVVFVLLIACANLAGVNIATGATRKREMAVRTALGAGRTRLIRQLLIEHMLIAITGGALGVMLAFWLVRLVTVSAADALPRIDAITLDPLVLLFALGATLLCGVLTGIIPAIQLSSTPLREQMSGSRGNVSGGRSLPGALLVGVEVAAAIVLLTGGMLLIRSYRALVGRDLGFETENVIAADVVLSRQRYQTPEERLVYWDRLLTELRATPGVVSAGAANWIPMGGGATSFVEVEGRSDPNDGAGYRAVGDDYFSALGVRLLAGRAISVQDATNSPRVAMINQSMARRFWGDENPIGRRLRTPIMESGPDNAAPAPWLTVVGVVEDMRHWGIEEEPSPEIYVAYRQVPLHAVSMAAVARVQGPPDGVLPALRAAVRTVDSQTPADIQLLGERIKESLQTRKLTLAVLTAFGGLALTLAAIGLYSLLSFAVAQRTREIAVRLALGARQSALLRMVFINAMKIVTIGAAVGLLAAAALTRFMSSMLVQVTPLDPLTLVIVTAVLMTAAALAALLPALRASRLSPLVALQSE